MFAKNIYMLEINFLPKNIYMLVNNPCAKEFLFAKKYFYAKIFLFNIPCAKEFLFAKKYLYARKK